MKAHLDAVKDRIESLGVATFIGWAYNPPARYVVLEPVTWDGTDELPLCGPDDVLDETFRVKAVAGTTVEGALILLDLIRDELSPGRRWASLTVAGRSAEVKHLRMEMATVDQSVTATSTDRHPAFGVDSYRLMSQPSEEESS